MRKLEIKNEREQAQKHFYGTAEIPWGLAVFTIFMGIISTALAGDSIFTEAKMDVGNVIGFLLGCGYVGLGGWEFSFSKGKKGSFSRNAVVVFESDFGLLWWLGAFLQFVAFLGMMQFPDTSLTFFECLVWGSLILITCLLGVLCFFVSRNQRIILLEDSVEYFNGLGRSRCWNNKEIGRIIVHPIIESYTVLGKDGERLFGFRKSMVNAHVLLCRFPVEMEMPVGRTEEEKSFSNELTALYEKKLRRAGWWLFGVDLLGRFLVLFFYFYTQRARQEAYSFQIGSPRLLQSANLLGLWDFYLLLGLISLDLFVFTWIFRDALWEDWTYEKNTRQKWKGIHGDIIIRQMALMIFSFLPVRRSTERTLQCIHGREKMLLLGFALFILLLLSCVYRLGREKLQVRLREFRLWQLVLLSGYTLLVSMVLTNSIFGVTGKIPVHDLAEVAETDYSHSSRGGNQYYASVALENGIEERLLVSKDIYDRINRQEDVVLCWRFGLFGTEFAAVHIPGECPLKGEKYADYHITGQADAGGYGFHRHGGKTDFYGGNEEAPWEASDL